MPIITIFTDYHVSVARPAEIWPNEKITFNRPNYT